MTIPRAQSVRDLAPGESIRLAVPDDNAALLDLERQCPQGTTLRIASERTDYFFRSSLYGNDHTLVAVDQSRGRLIGVVTGAVKEVMIAGRPVSASLVYDLRVHPDYRRAFAGRHMLRAWNLMTRWAETNGSELLYGLVKSDNAEMLGVHRKKREYRFVGKMVVIGRPVYRHARLRVVPREVDLARENERMAARVRAQYGSHLFFPTAFRDGYVTDAMRASGLFSCYEIEDGGSYASVGVFRVSRTARSRVLALPWYYRAARPVLDALRRVIPTPRIPGPGDTIAYCHLFNHLAEGPRGLELWHELVRHANNLALEDGVSLLMSAFDESDAFLPRFSRGALNRIDYLLSVQPFSDSVAGPFTPYYPDIRDMV
jgi:ribosomal protein S18 acetylase RimI-like enzyme